MDNTPQKDKAALRRRISRYRKALNPNVISAAGDQIRQHLLAWSFWDAIHTAGCYLALDREVPTRKIILTLQQRGVKVYVPAWDPARKAYRFAALVEQEPCVPGPHRVPQPRKPRWLETDSLDIILVPGVAFDPKGRRLGFGQGHYDRLLGCLKGVRIALCFAGQIVTNITEEPHDQRMDYLVSEQGLKKTNDKSIQ